MYVNISLDFLHDIIANASTIIIFVEIFGYRIQLFAKSLANALIGKIKHLNGGKKVAKYLNSLVQQQP